MSQKPAVFRHLFQSRYNSATGVVAPTTVTMSDIQEAIMLLQQEEGITLSVSNPANFLKDFLRMKSRNQLWPSEILAAGYTARQAYGQGRVFDFVSLEDEQTEAFPDKFVLPYGAVVHEIESVSMPSAARALGRDDESWLIQVCVHQRVLQTHFALFSDMVAADLFHLQNSLKGTPEIDAVFLLTFREGGKDRKAIITFEAKRDEPILMHQLQSQVATMAKQASLRSGLKDIEFIVPVAANTSTREGRRVVALFEMAPISVQDGIAAFDGGAAHEIALVIAKSVGYAFRPAISGI